MLEIAQLVASTRSKTLLYAEDDHEIRKNVAALLSNLFGEVVAVQDGQEALEAFKERSFDVLVTDIKMPRMNGIALIESVLALNPSQMIVITTAYDDKEYQDKFRELGVPYVLQKPITFEALLRVLNDITAMM